jgi:CheY-like chemotaxis protein
MNRGKSPATLLLVHPLPDATLADAVTTLRAQSRLPVVCCLNGPDRDLKATLAAQGVGVLQQPIKQSTLHTALAMVLGTATATPGRRTSDATDPAAVDRQAARKHRLLLAEDNPVNQRVAVHMLNKLGYAVDVVDNGALAVTAVAGGDYALVLMDCQMPEMDGFAATAAIRGAEAGNVPQADHRDDRQRHAGRPRTLPGGRHGRLPGQADRHQPPGGHADAVAAGGCGKPETTARPPSSRGPRTPCPKPST